MSVYTEIVTLKWRTLVDALLEAFPADLRTASDFEREAQQMLERDHDQEWHDIYQRIADAMKAVDY